MLFRFFMIGLFSFAALSVWLYQGIEVAHAITDYFKHKS
ncbi:hypothetical protein SAMN05216179_3274 [Gracilibacillus kekensis]|uniref:Uncharacterized protein n=1 Tax=Gracilibacillus kekensis TaxID=1027249 RepID=A0A1M7QJV5_9BACI|nr:hypothetical protein SAMN05216179_3274 [Gracilibacillus kekensis]